MPALFDLHTHTTASDGRLAPRDLVCRAADEGLAALAVTDHDTVDAIDEAREEAGPLGLEIIAGIEVSASCHGASVHILGLFVKYHEPWLIDFFFHARQRRIDRIHRILQRLASAGVHLEAEEVFAKSTHGTIGRPHVAQVLVEKGVVSSFVEAFDRYLAQGAPAYVGYERVTCRDAIELIRRAGGVASLAHPGLLDRDELIPEMVDQGLQAIEAFHSEHSTERAVHYFAMAQQLNLLVTGGSDFHAPEGQGTTRLGCSELTAEAVGKLREVAQP